MKKIYWIHAVTPMHVGSGKGVGYIDLPIIREKVTNWPMIPGSAIKGVLRDYHENKKTPNIDAAFGTAGNESARAGAVVLTDARIVCLPVRSLHGTFAWCASPMSLARMKRDMETAGETGIPEIVPAVAEAKFVACAGAAVKDGSSGKVYLEDLDLADGGGSADAWADFIAGKAIGDIAFRAEFKKRFLVLSDDVFNFLCETGTEVSAHIKIKDDTKTTQDGALWYEESLPAETILAGIAWCDKVYGGGMEKEKLMETFCPEDGASLQFGGKSTTGKGRAKMRFTKGAN